MKKPISKNDYSRFNYSRTATRHLASSPNFITTFSTGVLKVFGDRGLLSREVKDRIKYLAKHEGEVAVRAYVEEELVEGFVVKETDNDA
jgi:hypothetical protein